jgi:hypothetical protein
MPPTRQGDKGVDRPYYSERAGRAPAPARLDLPELKRLLQTFLAGLISDGYYDPEREAIVMESCHEVVSVFLVRETDVVDLGTLVFVSPT